TCSLSSMTHCSYSLSLHQISYCSPYNSVAWACVRRVYHSVPVTEHMPPQPIQDLLQMLRSQTFFDLSFKGLPIHCRRAGSR
ncbi:unnamed protein product, partial [Mycena citricolor]